MVDGTDTWRPDTYVVAAACGLTLAAAAAIPRAFVTGGPVNVVANLLIAAGVLVGVASAAGLARMVTRRVRTRLPHRPVSDAFFAVAFSTTGVAAFLAADTITLPGVLVFIACAAGTCRFSLRSQGFLWAEPTPRLSKETGDNHE